ncbi:MAG: TetR/AcrR family transcriptional regulator [Polyangiales bacterium]
MVTKGTETRERILDRAFRTASRDGLEGLSIGGLASELGLSKSGLFAHFGSKEDLQVAVLERAAEHFEAVVMKPAFRAPRGLPRLRKVFDLWMAWADDPGLPGGCIFMAAAAELDDREGRPRDTLIHNQRRLFEALGRCVKLAIEEKHFRRELDPEQVVFELYGILLSFNHYKRLLRAPDAERRTHAAFERLVSWASNPT